MTRRQLAVPMVAALLGGAVTAAGMLAGSSGNGSVGRQQGLLALDSGERFSAAEIYERAAPSVVSISARSVQPGAAAFQAEAGSELGVTTGSGFVLDGDGRIVTNAHVVSGVTAVQVTFPDGQIVSAQVIGKDEQTDLAVLRVPSDQLDLRPLELDDSDSAQPGDRVVAVGNPTGLQATAGTGRISAAGQSIEAPGGYVIEGLLETDAVIEPSTSGGPLLGEDGRVVGITSRFGDDTGFAVPAGVARNVLAQLEERHKVIRPWLGIRGRAAPGGVALIDVQTGGPADSAALQAGDVVQAIDGVEVGTLVELLQEVDRRSVGDTVELRVLRDGSPTEITVRLEERPATVPAG
jgi:S1-C subfamily serine protease